MAKLSVKEKTTVKELIKTLVKQDNRMILSEIASRAKVSRPTFYAIIEDLRRSGEITDLEISIHKGNREPKKRREQKTKKTVKTLSKRADELIGKMNDLDKVSVKTEHKKQVEEKVQEEKTASLTTLFRDSNLISQREIDEGESYSRNNDGSAEYDGRSFIKTPLGIQKTREIPSLVLDKVDSFADIDFRVTLTESISFCKRIVSAIERSSRLTIAEIDAVNSVFDRIARLIDVYTKTYALISIQQQHEMEKRILFEVLSERINQDDMTDILKKVSSRIHAEREQSLNPDRF